jgi:hypothetical protein
LHAAGAGLLGLELLQLLVLILQLKLLLPLWLLQGRGRASFPLVDPLLHRRLVRLGVFVGRCIGGDRI